VISLIKPNIAKGFIQETNINLVDIQGNSISTCGRSKVELTLPGGIVVQHNFVVIDADSFQENIILGIDFLRHPPFFLYF